MSSLVEQESLDDRLATGGNLRPLVSIVIPAYNTAAFLGEAIESALAQTYRPIEIIVVDDGSTDDSLTIARDFAQRHPDTIRVFTQDNAGACTARNYGLRESSGEYVKFLDADDALTPVAIASQLAALDGEPPDVIPYGTRIQCDEALRPLPHKGDGATDPKEQAYSYDKAERAAWLIENNIQTARPLYPRALVAEVSGFSERLRRAQEYDLHIRLALAGGRFKGIAEPGVLVREHDAPTRITNCAGEIKATAPGAEAHPDINGMLRGAFGDELPPPLQGFLARSAWRSVRRLVRAGDTAGARALVAKARRLDPGFNHVLGRTLRALYRLPGPIATERAREVFRRLVRRS